MENFKLLFQMYADPVSAISGIMDKGSWIFGSVAVLLVSIAFYSAINAKLEKAYGIPQFKYADSLSEVYRSEAYDEGPGYEGALESYQQALRQRQEPPFIGDRLFWFFSFEPSRFYVPLVSILCFYVPATILLIALFAHLGSFSVVFGREYGVFATASLMAWAAAHLPFAIAGILAYSFALDPKVYLAMWAASGLAFGIFMVFVVRTIFGSDYGKALFAVALSWLAFSAGIYIFRFISPLLFSPFILFYAYLYFGGSIRGGMSGFSNTFRQRQNFKRFLHNATINPRDADAHIQLGLIYKQRRLHEKAREHFTKAFEIDSSEIDANYELGKIAREQGELQKAIEHFSVVVEQNDKHSLSEIWREIGHTYFVAGMHGEARNALETFIERRSYDPEGLYYLGRVYKALGETEKARSALNEAIEAAENAPSHRRYEMRHWGKLARKEL